jgi:hypothetical protein
MLERVIRILLGFALASLAAAATLVAFVYAPGDMSSLRTDLSSERLLAAGVFALEATPHVILTAAFPALLAAVFAETRKIAGWPFHVLAGSLTGAAGFFLQHLSEGPDPDGIFQAYALIAFLTAGLTGGLVYWATSGRFAAAPGSAPKP